MHLEEARELRCSLVVSYHRASLCLRKLDERRLRVLRRTLREQLKTVRTRELLSDVLEAAQAPDFPATLFIHRSSVEAADTFFTARAPDVRAISDANGDLFAAFDLKKGRLAQLLGPSAWRAGLRAPRPGAAKWR